MLTLGAITIFLHLLSMAERDIEGVCLLENLKGALK